MIKSLLTAAIAATLSTGVYAQSSGLILEEVVVTAQKRAQSTQDIGMSIVAQSGEALGDMGVIDSSDLAAVTPGLVYANAGTGSPVYSIRGVGFYDNAAAAASTVGVYVDEAALPYPVMTSGAVLDVERVEVLKGPQGTLYGLNTTGGAIKYIANKPSEEFEFGIKSGIASHKSIDLEGYLSGAIGDTTNARVSYKTTQASEGWQQNSAGGDDLGEVDKHSARLQFNFLPSDDLDVLLSLSWWNDKSDTQAAQATDWEFQAPANTPVSGELEDNGLLGNGSNKAAGWDRELQDFLKKDEEYKNATATVNYDLNEDVTVTSVTSYQEFSRINGYDVTGTGYRGVSSLNISEIEAFSQEFRLSGGTDSVDWVAGAYYYTDTVMDQNNQGTVLTTNTPGLNSLRMQSEIKTDAKALFAHADWQFTEDFKANFGLRFTDEEKRFSGCTMDNNDYAWYDVMGEDEATGFINGNFGPLLTAPVIAGECASLTATPNSLSPTGFVYTPGQYTETLSESNVSGRIGLDWTPTAESLVYVNVSRGFKGGGFPTVSALYADQLSSVKSEQVLAYELGFKQDLFEGSAQLNGSVYHYDYKNKQLQGNIDAGVFGILAALRNVDKSSVTGAEVDFKWRPMLGLDLGLSGTLTKTEVIEYVDIDETGGERDFAGDTFPYTPELQLSASVNYTRDLNDNLIMFAGGEINYTDDAYGTFGSADERFAIDSYSLVNARIGVESSDGHWRSMVWVKNLTGEDYSTNVVKTADVLVSYQGKPRTVGLSVAYNY